MSPLRSSIFSLDNSSVRCKYDIVLEIKMKILDPDNSDLSFDAAALP